MFHKKEIKLLQEEVTRLNIKLIGLDNELKEKTTINYPLGGFITWCESKVLIKDVVKDIVKEMGYRINHKTQTEVNTYIEKNPKKTKFFWRPTYLRHIPYIGVLVTYLIT